MTTVIVCPGASVHQTKWIIGELEDKFVVTINSAIDIYEKPDEAFMLDLPVCDKYAGKVTQYTRVVTRKQEGHRFTNANTVGHLEDVEPRIEKLYRSFVEKWEKEHNEKRQGLGPTWSLEWAICVYALFFRDNIVVIGADMHGTTDAAGYDSPGEDDRSPRRWERERLDVAIAADFARSLGCGVAFVNSYPGAVR